MDLLFLLQHFQNLKLLEMKYFDYIQLLVELFEKLLVMLQSVEILIIDNYLYFHYLMKYYLYYQYQKLLLHFDNLQMKKNYQLNYLIETMFSRLLYNLLYLYYLLIFAICHLQILMNQLKFHLIILNNYY